MEHIGVPLIGDQLYGAQTTKLTSKLKKADYEDEVRDKIASFPHQALHAAEIMFIHPRTDEEMHFQSDIPDDMAELIALLDA